MKSLRTLSGVVYELKLEPAGAHRAWIKAEALAGRIPCLRIGRKVYFSPEAVEQAMVRTASEVPPADKALPEKSEQPAQTHAARRRALACGIRGAR